MDYQLGGAYSPPDGVAVVARDRTEARPDVDYAICYVNGFQTQPGEQADWPSSVLLRDESGDPVIDPDWPDEVLLDTRTSASRAAILEVVGPWIDGCSAAGYNAVEFDNLDTYTRSDGVLTRADAITLARAFVARAHADGLAAAQKNAAEDVVAMHAKAGFDFAVTEECAQFDECSAYTDVYGPHVLDIEYTDAQDVPITTLCRDRPDGMSAVLRDRDLVSPDDSAYVRQSCPAE